MLLNAVVEIIGWIHGKLSSTLTTRTHLWSHTQPRRTRAWQQHNGCLRCFAISSKTHAYISRMCSCISCTRLLPDIMRFAHRQRSILTHS